MHGPVAVRMVANNMLSQYMHMLQLERDLGVSAERAIEAFFGELREKGQAWR